MNKEILLKKRLILASQSPRRRELIQKLGLPFEAEASDVDETIPEGMDAVQVPEYLSGLKAKAVYDLHKGEDVLVVGSDTVVILGDVIFGKPKDEADAFRMLKALSGNWHKVATGVTVLSGVPGSGEIKQSAFTYVSDVKFFELSDDEIREYIASGEPMDKAGSYGIQQGGALIVERINGDFYSVMGLPIASLAQTIKKM